MGKKGLAEGCHLGRTAVGFLMDTQDDGAAYMAVRVKGDCFGLIDHNYFENNSRDLKIYGNDESSWESYPGENNIGIVMLLTKTIDKRL